MIYTLSCVDFIHIMIIKCCDLWNPEDCNEIPEVEGTEVNNKTAPVPKANKFELTFRLFLPLALWDKKQITPNR